MIKFKQRRLLFILLTAIISIGFLVASQFFRPFSNGNAEFSKSTIKGISIERKGLSYTLNFEQQSKVIKILSHSIRTMEHKRKENFDYPVEKMVLHRFDRADTELIPIAYSGDNLVFLIQEDKENVFLLETSMGKLKELLLKASRK